MFTQLVSTILPPVMTHTCTCTHDKLMIALWQNDSIVMYHKKSAVHVPVLIPRPCGKERNVSLLPCGLGTRLAVPLLILS